MTEQESLQLFKCLSDRSRLQILKSLLEEDMYVERLSERLGLSAATVSFHLKKLSEAGAVTSHKEQYYTLYSINRELFAPSLLTLLGGKTEKADEMAERDEQYRKKVIASFFEYGKLRAIPVQRKKERIVLEELVKAFEPDRDYTEKEVSETLMRYYDDYCTLRRDMISEKLMTRTDGVYRRVKNE